MHFELYATTCECVMEGWRNSHCDLLLIVSDSDTNAAIF
jgi:hypothetical protein